MVGEDAFVCGGIDRGELVEHGPAAEVFERPRDPRTAAYISGEIS